MRARLETAGREPENAVGSSAGRSRHQCRRRSVPAAHHDDAGSRAVEPHGEVLAGEDPPRRGRRERCRIGGHDAERRHDATVIGGIGIAFHVDVGPPASPTSFVPVVSAGPCTRTQSIRSCTSSGTDSKFREVST